MKKVLAITVAALVLALAAAGSAEARCGVRCLNQQVKQLTRGLKKAEQTIATQGRTIAQQSQAIAAVQNEGAITGKKVNALYSCLVEIPLTQYGQPEGPFGYLFQYENEAEEVQVIETTALDATYPGDGVGGWALFDECNTASTASAATATATGALAQSVGLSSFPQPQALRP